MSHSYFQGRVTLMHFAGIEDSRGVLVPIDFQSLNFSPVRSFFVNGINGVARGGHAHRQGTQLLLRISGDIQIELSFHGEDLAVTLGPEANALMLCAPVWSRQTYRGESPVLLVFSDQRFDPSDYMPARE
jgi:hypothetical protein